MPKVLRIINRFNLGGITYNVAYLSKYLPTDYETLLIGGPEEENEESSLYITNHLELKPVIIKELKREINFKNDFLAYKKIKQIIREFNPDIVHTHASKAGAVGRLAAIHCKVPVIIHTFHGHVFHSYFGRLKTFFYKSIERYLAKRSTAIIAISEIQKKELCEKYKICTREQTHVIGLGFDLKKFTENTDFKRKQFREKYALNDDEMAIGIIGRLAPIKNHELFISAVEHVANASIKKVRAFIIGDGETKQQLVGFINSKKLSYTELEKSKALFTFTSWITEIDVALAGLDIIALSSKNEGTPVSLIEAQAAGKFIVTTNVGGVADILNRNNGFLCNPDKPNDFSENLLKAVNEFETLNKISGNEKDTIIKKHNYLTLCKNMTALYNNLLKKTKR